MSAATGSRDAFYKRDAMLARVFAIGTCPSVRLSRACIISKWKRHYFFTEHWTL